jgi:hypothetical protein
VRASDLGLVRRAAQVQTPVLIDPSGAGKPDEIFKVLFARNSCQKTQKLQAKSTPPVIQNPFS